MIPADTGVLRRDFAINELPSKTFRLHEDGKIIGGHADGQEAMEQAIYLILNTERYRYMIYSWNYGVELHDLIGKPIAFCLPEIKRRITEALLQDSRITAVDGFTFEVGNGVVHVRFRAITIFGAINGEKAVAI